MQLPIGIRQTVINQVISRLSTEVNEFFVKEEIDKIARETKFVQRKSTLGAMEFLDLLVFTRFNQLQLSLNDMAGILTIRHGIKISKQGIDERFNGFCHAFIGSVLEKILSQQISSLPEWKKLFANYGKIRIKDSTCFQLPECMSEAYPGSGGNSSNAAVRIQFEYDIKSGKVLDLSIHPFTEQDIEDSKLTVYEGSSNDIFVRDLGYVCIKSLKQIEQNNGFYINRPQVSISIWYIDKDGEKARLNLSDLYNYMKENKIEKLEKEVWLGSKKDFKTRLIIFLVPEDKINERIRKINKTAKRKGRKVCKEYMAKAGLNLFITNVPEKDMQPIQIWNIYRLRWQIELIFKVWKSIGQIHIVKKVKTKRFECFLLARLIWVMINWKIIWGLSHYYWQKDKIIISVMKVFKQLTEFSHMLRQSILEEKQKLNIVITKLFDIEPKNFTLEEKKDKISMKYILDSFC